MTLFAKFTRAVRAWWRRRGGPTDRIRGGMTLEQLDHRQLLSVTFSGNTLTDFGVGTRTDVAFINADNVPNVVHPTISPVIAPIVKVSGFDLHGIALAYDPTTDTLSVGLDQPPSVNHPGEVMAG